MGAETFTSSIRCLDYHNLYARIQLNTSNDCARFDSLEGGTSQETSMGI